jgi:hypothetical protein
MATTTRKKPAAKSAARKTMKPVKRVSPGKSSPTPIATSLKPGAKPKAEKTDKVKKPKLVRDSFTFPKTEYEVLAALKQRALKLAHPIKKSELVRAGIKAIAGMTDATLLQALKDVPTIKTGRPKKV